MAIVILRPGGAKLLLRASSDVPYPPPAVDPLNVDVFFQYKGDAQAPQYLGTFPVGKQVEIPFSTDLDRDVVITTVARGPLGQQHVSDVRDAPRLVAQSEREQRKPIIGQMGASTYSRAIIGVSYLPRHLRTRRILVASDSGFSSIIAEWYQDIDRSGKETPRMTEQFSINRLTAGIDPVTYYIKVAHSSFSTTLADTSLTYQQQLQSLRWGPDSDVLTVTLAGIGGTGGSSGTFNPFTATFQGYGSGAGDLAFSVPMPGDPSGGVVGSSGGFDARLAIWRADSSLDYALPIYADRTKGRILTNGYTLPSGITILAGTGSPEGVAGNEAPVGSRYFRDDGTWYKKSAGTGNTGWVQIGDPHVLMNQTTALPAQPSIAIDLYNPARFVNDSSGHRTLLQLHETNSGLRNLVTRFGADPLGGSDISSLLQAAASEGAKVVLPPGTYLMTAPVTLAVATESNSFIIEGHGIGSTTIHYTGSSHAFIAPNGANSFFKIKDLKILCTNSGNAGDCFHLMGDASSVNTHIELNNVGIWNFGRWAVNADNIQSSNIVNCWFRGQKAGHIQFNDSDDIVTIKEPNANSIRGCLLDNCQADDQNVAAIRLFHANGVNITGCTIQGNFVGSTGNLHAISAENCDSLNINGVWVEDLCAGGSGIYLKGCRAVSINGYHGSGGYPADIVLENNPQTIKLSGCTLTNSVPHIVTIDSAFGVEIENSVLSDPSNIWPYETTGFIHVGANVHYSSNGDPNHTEYVGTDTLHSNWGENLYPNPNAVDDASGYTVNSSYVTRITTDSPFDVGACFEFNSQGAADYPNMIADAPVFQLDYVIPDNVPANFYTFSCWVKVVDDGAADDVTRYVGLGFTMFGSTGGQNEKTRQFKNQVQGFLNPPVGKWMSWCRNIYVPPTSVFGTGRTLRFRIKPEETTKGPNTPKIRIGGFRLAQGRNAQQGHAKFITEEFTHTLRGPDGLRLASRPSATAPPSGIGALRYNAGAYEGYDHSVSDWTTLGAQPAFINVAEGPYLAIGNGTTDVTSDIQDAIDLAASGYASKQIFLPPGRYYVPGGLTLSGEVQLFGAGDRQTVLYSDANTPILTLADHDYRGATISNLMIEGAKTAGSSQVGLSMNASPFMLAVRVEKVTIKKTGGTGLFVGNVFSGSFRDIFIDDVEGWGVEVDAPNMPCLMFDNVYPGAISASHPVGWRIKRAQNILLINCNGINSVPPGAAWMAIGMKNSVYGDSTNASASVTLLNCNIESFHTWGIRCLRGSNVNLLGRCTIARQGISAHIAGSGIDDTQTSIPVTDMDAALFPTTATEFMVVEGSNVEFMQMSSRTTNVATVTRGTPAHVFSTAAVVYPRFQMAIEYDIDTAGTYPELAIKPTIADTCTFQDGPLTGYKKGQAIHANAVPPLSTLGEGPGVASDSPLGFFWNTTTNRAEPLVRADGKSARFVMAAGGNIPFGATTVECRFTAPGTVNLYYAGFDRRPGPILVFDGAGTAGTHNITVSGTGVSHTINQDYGAVWVYPESDDAAWRVVGEYPLVLPGNVVTETSGATDYVPKFISANGIGPSDTYFIGTTLVHKHGVIAEGDGTDNHGGPGNWFNRYKAKTSFEGLYFFFRNTSISLLSHSGNPEGVSGFEAEAGSYCWTPGALYKKVSGSGNTGWMLHNSVLSTLTSASDNADDLGTGSFRWRDLHLGRELVLTAGVRQIFAPNSTTPGLNVGVLSGDPSSPSDGDVWYNTSINKYRGRENGTVKDLISTGGGGGAQFDSGVYSSLPGSPATDDAYLVTDGHTLERYNGSAWESFGPIYHLTPPPAHSNWTDINSGSGTFEDQPRCLHVNVPYNASDNLRGMDKAAPSTPYTIIALVEWNLRRADYNQAGLLFADNSGKYETFELAHISGDWRMRVNRWNSATSNAGSTPFDQPFAFGPRLWLKIRDDGSSNRLYSYSYDGKNFEQVHAEGRTNHITATRVGFFGNGGGATQPLDVRLLSWAVS